jgi:hypothetical protein
MFYFKSQKFKITTLSSMESEYVTMSPAVTEVMFVRQLLDDIVSWRSAWHCKSNRTLRLMTTCVIVGRNIISAVMCRLFHTLCIFPPLVLHVRLQRWWQQCQPYLTTVHIRGMLGLVVIYYVSVLICVWNTYFCFYFMLGIHFHFLQHHSIYD